MGIWRTGVSVDRGRRQLASRKPASFRLGRHPANRSSVSEKVPSRRKLTPGGHNAYMLQSVISNLPGHFETPESIRNFPHPKFLWPFVPLTAMPVLEHQGHSV